MHRHAVTRPSSHPIDQKCPRHSTRNASIRWKCTTANAYQRNHKIDGRRTDNQDRRADTSDAQRHLYAHMHTRYQASALAM
eukprot:scaffold37056_cov36-Tisochrysis_lutea.AAC.2